ncbi:MAG: hypothetical protein ABSD46_05855 [Bacteroidota bacterium]
MMGKSYELIGDLIKARWAYEELNTHYPDNDHARVVKSRLNALKQNLPTPKNIKHKKQPHNIRFQIYKGWGRKRMSSPAFVFAFHLSSFYFQTAS